VVIEKSNTGAYEVPIEQRSCPKLGDVATN